MLLIVTNRKDLTADWLVLELHRRGAPFVRFNTEDYPGAVRFAWRPDGSGWLKLPSGPVDLDEIEAVWYRRPVMPGLRKGLSPEQAHWARAEAVEGLDGLWRTLQARWVNHPDRNRPASSKPWQLRAAIALGFRVPATLMTNDADEARAFVADQPSGAIVKPVRQGRIAADEQDHLFFTSPLQADSPAFAALDAEPYLFQERIDKAADVRVTVIGDDALAVRIYSQEHADANLDFRRTDPGRLRHELMSLPPEEARRCVRFVKDAGCCFGAIDLAETSDGGFVFFENNPNGQWAWLEQLCGVPLRSCLADLLLAPRTPT